MPRPLPPVPMPPTLPRAPLSVVVSGLAAAVPAALRFVAYYRVSTDRQGKSGLGLEAQRVAVAKYVAGAGGVVAAEFEEVESGKRNDRPQLAAALAACRARRAALVIAKLDRLARNARFLLHVVEGTGEAGVVFCDLPQVPPGPVGKFLLTQMAAVAELEAGLTSQHARAAAAVKSAQARARAADVLPYLEAAHRAGARTLHELAEALTNRGVPTPAGKGTWQPEQVRRVQAAGIRPVPPAST